MDEGVSNNPKRVICLRIGENEQNCRREQESKRQKEKEGEGECLDGLALADLKITL